jgi:DNA-binding GntR family transcriptional regulator
LYPLIPTVRSQLAFDLDENNILPSVQSFSYTWQVKQHKHIRRTRMIAIEPKVRKASKSSASKAERSGLTDQRVHAQLYAAIIDHRIPPGTALLEDRLAKAFSVSRTIIRKVLQQLSHQKLVDIIPNKGASVAKPNAEEARQVFEARREVERILVARVATSASDAEIKGLLRLAKSEQSAFTKGQKTERLKLSGDFHRQLASLSANLVLEHFLEELVSRTSLIIALYESPGAVPCSHTEHLEIANALIARDASKAIQYMEHHLRHIEAQIDLTPQAEAASFEELFSRVNHKRKR